MSLPLAEERVLSAGTVALAVVMLARIHRGMVRWRGVWCCVPAAAAHYSWDGTLIVGQWKMVQKGRSLLTE